MNSIGQLDDFRALEPFFRIVEEALVGLADGAHFFDLLADDVVFDYIITVPATHGTSSAARRSPSCIARTGRRSS
jgi:hypothetical protein